MEHGVGVALGNLETFNHVTEVIVVMLNAEIQFACHLLSLSDILAKLLVGILTLIISAEDLGHLMADFTLLVLQLLMTSHAEARCYHHQSLDKILRAVIVHRRSDVPSELRIAEEEFGVVVADKGFAQTVPEFGRVQTCLLAAHRIFGIISGIKVTTSRCRRILEVTEQIAIVETTAFGSEVHEPEISTIGVVGDIGFQRLLVKDLLEAIVPSLGEHHGIVQIFGDFMLEIHIELRTDNEDGWYPIHACHIASTFIRRFSYKLLNPIGDELIHVGTLHIFLIMAEEQHVDDMIVGVFVEQISYLATLHHDVNHQGIHREILARTSTREVEQVVAVENILREGLTGYEFARLGRDCIPVILNGTFEC